MYFSAKTGGFYTEEVHRDSMPADVVAIARSAYLRLLAGQASGQRIASSATGSPVLLPALRKP